MSGRPNNHSELDDYVRQQLEEHYGSDVVRSVSRTAPPSPPNKRFKKGFSFAVVACAAVFLTGAAMLAGVVIGGGLPTFGGGSTSSLPSEITSSQASSSAVESVSSAVASSAVESVSSAVASSAVENVSSAVASSAVENVSSAASSAVESVSSAASSPYENESELSTSSENDVESSNDNYSRIESYSLPDIPSEGSVVIESEDSAATPNESVTTGRRARAGIGIFLMIASLCSAAALYNLYNDKENIL